MTDASAGPRPAIGWVSDPLRALDRIGRSVLARALRDGLLWLVPYLMLWTALMLLGEWARAWPGGGAAGEFLRLAAGQLRTLLPLAMWGSVGAMRAVQCRLPRTPVAFACAAFGLVTHELLRWRVGLAAEAVQILLALVGPLFAVGAMARLGAWRWLRLVPRETPAGHNVAESLNLVLPAVLTLAALLLGTLALGELLRAWPLDWQDDLLRRQPAELLALVYAALNSLSWFFGVHGYYALLPLLEAIPELPRAGGVVSQGFLGAYVFIGGCGGTLSLVVALLLGSRQRTHRLIALVSLIPAAINVNELLLFGLPLILNPRLLLPFVAVPCINVCTAILVAQLGWVDPAVAVVPFNSPVIANALWLTDGDRGAVVLQLLNVALGAMVYLPFVLAWERERLQRARLPGLTTTESRFAQRQEEAALVIDDPVALFQRARREQASTAAHLQALRDFEFALHYQPKLDPASGRVVGCEALLRLDDGRGQVRSPGDFMPDLERAGLMREVDRWVLGAVERQLQAWRAEGLACVPVAVNVSAETLLDDEAVAQLVEQAARHPGLLVYEITEHSLVSDEQRVRGVLQRLRDSGAALHIDDFGTGYSSLSYLHLYPVDAIKIDRSFTTALGHERGREVFRELCALARQLGLGIVVEGVEEAWQLAHLPPQALVQGWYYAAALPPERFVDYLRNPGTGVR